MANAISVDVWGCCVSRDAFAIGGNDEHFEIKNYFQDASYPLQFAQHVVPDFKIEDYFNINRPMSYYKWFCADINKTIPEVLENSGSEWLVIDSRTFSHGSMSVPLGNGTRELITNHFLDERIKPFIEKGYISDIKDCSYTSNEDKEIVCGLKKFVEWCNKRYGSHIIMIETFDTPWHITKDGYVTINNHAPYSKDMPYYETYFHDYFYENTNCFIIHCPINILADDLQKWGKSSVHYIHEVYDYLYKSICLITREQNQEKINRELNILYLKATCQINSIINGNVKSKNNQLQRALLYAKEGDGKKALDLIAPLIDEDCVPALEYCSRIYRDGLGVEKNIGIAIDYLRKAIDLQSISAQQSLFDILWDINTPDSNKEMIEIAKPLAEKGERELQGRLARAYRNGRGVKKDLSLAAKWMRKAYENKLKWASWELFDILWDINTPDSNKEMIEIAKPLAENNVKELQGRLARAYREGKGVDKDLNLAIDWMKKAHENKLKWASSELCDMLNVK